MDRTKRIFRVLVSLLLVFALIVNISPIQARAVVPEATAIGIGITALLLFGFAGVAFHPETANDFVGVGNSVINYMTDWETKNNQSGIVDWWIEEVHVDLTGGGGNSPFKIPDGVKLALAAFIVSLLTGDSKIEVEEETAPAGYKYYNGVLLPQLPSRTGSYRYVVRYSDGSYTVYYCDKLLHYNESTNSIGALNSSIDVTYYYSTLAVGSSSWQNSAYKNTKSQNIIDCSASEVIYSNNKIPIVGKSITTDWWMDAGVVSDSLTYVVAPETLVGDVAPGIQEGTHTADDIELPEYVDTDSSIKYQGLVGTEAVQKMLDDLAHNELTFDEYKAIVGSGISGDTGDLGGDSGDGSDETQPVVPPNTDILDGLQGVQDGISQLPGQIGDSISDIMNQGQSDAQNTGQSGVDQIIDIIPDQSGDLMAALTSLTDVLSYEGTACVLPVPAIRIPALPGLFQEITVMEESEIDLEAYFQMIPEVFISLVRALFDIAVVGFCLKEFLGLLAGLANGFSKPVDQVLGGDD